MRVRLQFRLWQLLAAMTLCCLAMAWVIDLQRRVPRQAEALQVVHRFGGGYQETAGGASPWREWLAGGPVDRPLTVHLQRLGPDRRGWGVATVKGDEVRPYWEPNRLPELGEALQELRGLEYLDIDRTRIRGHTGLLIPRSRRLRWLSLHSSGVRSADLTVLSRVPNLVELSVRRTSVDDAGLAHIAQLSRLEVLDLSSTDVTDAGLPQLARLTRLKRLQLENTNIGDDGLRALASLPALEGLELGMTRVTEKSIAVLSELRTLLGVRVPNGWPAEAVAELQRQSPGLKISVTHYRVEDRPDAKARKGFKNRGEAE